MFYNIFMQTFLPYPDFKETAQCLDYRRLGKQRVEAYQIVKILSGLTDKKSNAWKNHPAVLMWKGYERVLIKYALTMCFEWSNRGYTDNLGVWFITFDNELFLNNVPITNPPWLGLKEFHESHQSNLVRKLPEHYRKFFPNVPDDIPYYWPTHFPSLQK